MSLRLLLEEMYPISLAQHLRDEAIDTLAVLEVPRLVAASDRAVLSWAHSEQRAVVTENLRHFLPLGATSAHSGLIALNAARWPRFGGGIGRIAAALVALDSSGHDQQQVYWLRPETVPGP